MSGGFRSLHPFPGFLYYAILMVFSMLLFHPLFLITSLFAMIGLNLLHDGGKQLRPWVGYYVITGLIIILVNPLFSHRGAYILFYLFDNPITLESVLYGITMMLSILTILVAFVSYNQMITSTKFIYLFSGIAPKVTLLMVIAMRFVPLLKRRLKDLSLVQRTRGIQTTHGSLRNRIKNGMKQQQILLTWSLEEAIQTADSMSARGYGLGKRSSYEGYCMEFRDWIVIILMVSLGAGCLAGWYFGFGTLTIYPSVESLFFDKKEWFYYGCFCLFLMIPVFMEGREKLRWYDWK
ncbi:MAG TPA: energy-coupling factor transporter transmembrane component T [Bacilli bacterium]